MTMAGILKFNNRNSGENYFKKWNSFQYSWLPDMIAAKTSYVNNDVVMIRIDQRQKGRSNKSDQREPKHIQSGRPRDRSVEVIGKMRKHIDHADGVLTFILVLVELAVGTIIYVKKRARIRQKEAYEFHGRES